jgi:hypothetical protein
MYWLLQCLRYGVQTSPSGFFITMLDPVSLHIFLYATVILLGYGIPSFLLLHRLRKATFANIALVALLPWFFLVAKRFDFGYYKPYIFHAVIASIVFWSFARKACGVAPHPAGQP